MRLGIIYGHIWQSQFKSADFLALAKKEWGETLHHIGDKNLNLAIEECRKRIEMPPTLPFFFQLCRSFQLCNQEKPKITITLNRSTPEIAKAYLLKMREILNKNEIKKIG